MKKLKCIMLIDDDSDDNFFHEITVHEYDSEINIITKTSAIDALEFLKTNKDTGTHPDLIFLDINMPRMNGWEFLRAYNNLNEELQSEAVIIMHTTSANPDDIARAKDWSFVSDYSTKPLTIELLQQINNEYFKVLSV